MLNTASTTRRPTARWLSLGVLAALALTQVASAQIANDPLNRNQFAPTADANISELEALAADLAAQYNAQQRAAQLWSTDTGARLRFETTDGRIVEILYLRDGQPIAYTTNNANAADSVSTDEILPGGISGFNLTGAGVLLREWDGGGVRTTHQEFGGRANQVDSPASFSDHSTHVAGTLIAAGVDPDALGMAPGANLDAYDWGADGVEMALAAANAARVSNHSYGEITGWDWGPHPTDPDDPDTYAYWWGNINISTVEDARFGYYNSDAAAWDMIATLAPRYLICKSVGNDRNDDHTGGHWFWDGGWTWSTDARDPDGGTTGYDCIPPKGNAKNILTVGAVEDVIGGYAGPGSVAMSSFSSWGPTDDGRIKPDIVGNGVNLYSTSQAADDAYTFKGGTSMSSPNLAGSFGLLIEHWRNTHGGDDMRSATLKGLAIHTADECGGADGPDYEFGWGLFNALTAAEHISLDVAVPQAIQEQTLPNGETFSYTFDYSGVGPIRATICWTDLPGTPPGLNQLDPPDLMLVHDLDLRVMDNTRATYLPWILDPANPAAAATTGDNFRDNVEVVDIATPALGEYTVEVTHKGQLVLPNQRFSLLITGDNQPPVALCIDESLELPADENCCVTVDVDDIDDGSFDPDGPAGVDTLCITAVDGVQVDCEQEVEICGVGQHSVTLTITDLAGESDSCTATVIIEDDTPPQITGNVVGGVVDQNCEFLVEFSGLISDNCCLDVDDVEILVALPTGNATLGTPTINLTQVSDKVVSVSGSVLVSDLTSCPATVRVRAEATDCAGNFNTRADTADVVDEAPPTVECDSVGGEVDENCEFLVTFTGTVTDNCCVTPDAVDVQVELTTANATLGTPTINKTQTAPNVVDITGSVLVSDLTSCPATVRVAIAGIDCCGNPSGECETFADVVDVTPPEITCPPDAFFEHGSFFCNDGEVLDWLNSTTATDNCDPDVEIVNDAPACGFPPDSVTLVTWTATDDCGNTSQCSATVTIPPLDRGNVTEKGSLLVYPDVELRWDASGNLIQETFISLTNDYDEDVAVKAYFVSETCTNRDTSFELTHHEPCYWAVSTGSPKGVPAWSVLGQPYVDPEGSGELISRGYIVLWATTATGEEIRFNHLMGEATIVNYAHGTTWEYPAWAFRTDCVGHGEQPLDCTAFDADGACCEAEVIPGNIDFDGFHHDALGARLVFNFNAAGSQAWSRPGFDVEHDTDLTLLVMNQDLRVESEGPTATEISFVVWNADEVGLTGMTHCILKWNQVLLRNLGGHFLRNVMQTDNGYARLDGVAGPNCPESTQAAVLGVVNRVLDTSFANTIQTGTVPRTTGIESGNLKYDVTGGGEEKLR